MVLEPASRLSSCGELVWIIPRFQPPHPFLPRIQLRAPVRKHLPRGRRSDGDGQCSQPSDLSCVSFPIFWCLSTILIGAHLHVMPQDGIMNRDIQYSSRCPPPTC
jgi:hypothetical protein